MTRDAAGPESDAGEPGDLGAYCRAIENHLCRRNEGHLVRVVGPAFDCVTSWATKGVPLRVAYRGIDRCVDRLAAKGHRRRPVRVEFCDADVLDVFDEWRRAVGVPAAAPDATGDEAGSARRHASLGAHLDRVVARLTALRASGAANLGEVVDALVAEIDGARSSAKGLRGEARRQLLDRLQAMDAQLLASMRERLDAATMAGLTAEAAVELAPFRDRMPPDAYSRAEAACIDRLVRDRFSLPVVAFE
ncbi:MAG TPA: hypothetical protein VGQ37_22535 [Vicinamibacterales bacterium]|jgi:hypothetical protein|nr:hypothetical protein [Vicinamibacterales bacterium]